MAEGKRNLCPGALYQYLVKPRLGRGLYCQFVMRRGTQCASGARADAKTAFTFSDVTGDAVRVDDTHRENVLRILICMLACIKDLKFVLCKIAHRIVVLVTRYHIQYHLTRCDMQDHWRLRRSDRLRILRDHRKAERRDETTRNHKISVPARLS